MIVMVEQTEYRGPLEGHVTVLCKMVTKIKKEDPLTGEEIWVASWNPTLRFQFASDKGWQVGVLAFALKHGSLTMHFEGGEQEKFSSLTEFRHIWEDRKHYKPHIAAVVELVAARYPEWVEQEKQRLINKAVRAAKKAAKDNAAA